MTENPKESEPIDADTLVTLFKRKGLLDEIRRKLYQDFRESDVNSRLMTAIENIVDDEVTKDPKILSRERGKAAVLMEGVISRQSDKRHGREKYHSSRDEPENIYKPVEKHIDGSTIKSDKLKKEIETMILELVQSSKNGGSGS